MLFFVTILFYNNFKFNFFNRFRLYILNNLNIYSLNLLKKLNFKLLFNNIVTNNNIPTLPAVETGNKSPPRKVHDKVENTPSRRKLYDDPSFSSSQPVNLCKAVQGLQMEKNS